MARLPLAQRHVTVIRMTLVAVAASLAAAVPAGASIGFRSASQGTATGTHSVAVATPARVAPGDVMIATVAAGGPRIALLSAGWTPIRTTDAGAALEQMSFYRVATANEPPAHVFAAASGSNDLAAGITAYSGVDATAPIDAVADAKRAEASALPSVTTTGSGALVVGAIAVASDVAVTPDSTLSLRLTESQPKARITVADYEQAVAGATGTRGFTTGGRTGEKSVQTIALRPAPHAAGSDGDAGHTPTDPQPAPPTSGWTLRNGLPISAELLATLPTAAARHATLPSGRAVPVVVGCPDAATSGCTGVVELVLAGDSTEDQVGAARRRRGRRSFKLAPGTRVAVPVRLDRRTIRRFKKRRRARMVLRVTVETSAGKALKTSAVTVRSRRAARRMRRPEG